jgi:hypothetical protein
MSIYTSWGGGEETSLRMQGLSEGGTGGNLPRAPSSRGAPKFAKTKKNNFERFFI